MSELSKKERVILELMKDERWWYGLDIIAKSNGEIGRGTVYVVLSRLTDLGFVESRNEAQGYATIHDQLPRKIYRITDAGKQAVS